MKIKKRINAHFNEISLPSADKVLPKEALLEKQPKNYKKPTLRLAVTALCLVAIITSVVLVLNKTPEPSPDKNVYGGISQGESSLSSNNASRNDNDLDSTVGNMSDLLIDGSYDGSAAPETSAHEAPDVQAPGVQEPDAQEPDASKPDAPNVITVYSDVTSGEFAGDMYRPEGYNYRIGSALAIMMSLNKDEETKFNVLVHTYDAIDLKSFLSEYDASLEVITVEIHGVFAGEGYYVRLTDSQIKELTDYGLRCHYIGSGLGDYRDMNWETEEGIRAYCEIWGDMYTFNEREVSLHSGDVFIVYFED